MQQGNQVTLTTVNADGTTTTKYISAQFLVWTRGLTAAETTQYPTANAIVYAVSRLGGYFNPDSWYVTETAAAVSTAAESMITLTETSSGNTIYVADAHTAREVIATGTGSTLAPEYGGQVPTWVVDESPAAIATLRRALKDTASISDPLLVDNIGEKTATAGTTFDNQIIHTEPEQKSVETGITAFATGGQANATQLTEGINDVTTVATAADSVKYPAAVAGLFVIVKNSDANAMDLFPASGDSINGLAVDTAISVPGGSVVIAFCRDATVWETGEIVAVDDGVVGAPAYTFRTQTDMGLYKVSSTQFGVAVSGALVGGFDASGLFTDTISEQSATAGVTIDGVLNKDGGIVIPAQSGAGGPNNAISSANAGKTLIHLDDAAGNGYFEVTTDDYAFATEYFWIGEGVGAEFAVFAQDFQVSGSGGASRLVVNDTEVSAKVVIDAEAGVTYGSIGTPGTGVTAVHYGDGRNFTTVLTVTGQSVDPPTAAAAEAHGHLMFTFPAGAHIHEFTYMSLALQGGGTVDADTPDVGIGSVIGSGANATLDLVGATAEDYITGQAATDCSGTASVAQSPAVAGYGTGISSNAAAGVKTVHFNYADNWAGADTLTLTGTLVMKWTVLA